MQRVDDVARPFGYYPFLHYRGRQTSGPNYETALVRLLRTGTAHTTSRSSTFAIATRNGASERHRWPAAVVVAALLVCAAASADLPADAPAPLTLANRVPLSDDAEMHAIDTIAAAQRVADDQTWPPENRVNFYVSQNQANALIQSVRFSVDDAAAITLDFSAPTALALADSDGLRRIARSSLPQGGHHLHAHLVYTDRYAMTPQPAELDWDGELVKQPGELSFELRLVRNLAATSARLDTQQWQLLALPENWLDRAVRKIKQQRSPISLFHPGERNDPAGCYARYLLALGQPEAALIELRRLAGGQDARSLPVEFWRQLAAAERAADLLDDAAAILQRLPQLGGDRAQLALERLALGEAYFGRGDLERAEPLLRAARDDLPPTQAQRWRFAQAQLLIARNQVPAAIKLLNTADSEAVEALRYMDQLVDSLRETGYGRYNLGVELLAHGEEQRGLSWLDLVGRSNSNDEQLLALRDKANLTLGWHFLEAKQGRTALGVLGRVRAEGPYSDAALLGIGWAELVPAGDIHWRSKLSNEPQTKTDYTMDLAPSMRHSLLQLKVLEPELHGERGPRSFGRDAPPKDRREGLQRAQGLWRSLLDQHGDSSATQEAALAVAYAYDQLDDVPNARSAYADAIAQLETAQQRLTDSIAALRNGALAVQLSQAADAFELYQTLAQFGLPPASLERGFLRELNRYRANAQLMADADALAPVLDRSSPNGGGGSGSGSGSGSGDGAADVAAADSSAAASTSMQSLAGDLRGVRAPLASEQLELGARLRDEALGLLAQQQARSRDYLRAAYFSAARLQDRRPAGDPQAH